MSDPATILTEALVYARVGEQALALVDALAAVLRLACKIAETNPGLAPEVKTILEALERATDAAESIMQVGNAWLANTFGES